MRSTILSLAILPALLLVVHPLDHVLRQVDVAFETALNAVQDANLDDATAQHVSNVLKTRHETVKNAIGNIR